MTVTLPQHYGALPITTEQAVAIFGDELKGLLESGEMRGNLKTFGPWSIPLSFRAHAVSSEWVDNPSVIARRKAVTFWGERTMTHPRESGYNLEGRVFAGGKKRRAFTSGDLLDIDGRLVQIATIHVCMDEPKEAS